MKTRVRRGQEYVELDFSTIEELREFSRALALLERFAEAMKREAEEVRSEADGLKDSEAARRVFERVGRKVASEATTFFLRGDRVLDFSEDIADGDGHLDAGIFRAVIREGPRVLFEVMYDIEEDEATLAFSSEVEE